MGTSLAPTLSATLARVQNTRAAERADMLQQLTDLHQPENIEQKFAVENLANAQFRSLCMADVEAKLLFEGQPTDETLKLFLKYAALAERQLQAATRRMDKLLRERNKREKNEDALGSWRTRGEQHNVIKMPQDQTSKAGALCSALNEALLESQVSGKPVQVEFDESATHLQPATKEAS